MDNCHQVLSIGGDPSGRPYGDLDLERMLQATLKIVAQSQVLRFFVLPEEGLRMTLSPQPAIFKAMTLRTQERPFEEGRFCLSTPLSMACPRVFHALLGMLSSTTRISAM